MNAASACSWSPIYNPHVPGHDEQEAPEGRGEPVHGCPGRDRPLNQGRAGLLGADVHVFARTGCAREGIPDPAAEGTLGADSTKYVDIPLDTVMQYYFRAVRTVGQRAGHAPGAPGRAGKGSMGPALQAVAASLG